MGNLTHISDISRPSTHSNEVVGDIAAMPEYEYNQLHMTVKELVAAYPSLQTSPLTVGVYVADLSRLPVADVKEAIRNLRTKLTYFPSVSEIYQEVSYLQQQRARRKAEKETRQRLNESRVEGIPMPPDIKEIFKKMGLFKREIVGNAVDE